jgi:branched-subunit amino acid transport protein AzlD
MTAPSPIIPAAQAPTAPTMAGLDGPPVEQQLAKDMLRRALPAAPVLVVLASIPWGVHGALSSAFAIALVLANFALSAALLSWTARISLGLLMGTALFGYLVRLGLIAGAVIAVHNLSWFSAWPLGLTLIVTHLGLLLWEMRFVSASLAFPGLKPTQPRKD